MKKFRLDFDLDAWIQNVEIEAKDEQDALSKLSGMTVEELIQQGYVHSWNFSDCDVTLIESDYRARVRNIVAFDPDEQNQVPDSLIITGSWKETDDLAELIMSELEWKLDIAISSFEYDILSDDDQIK